MENATVLVAEDESDVRDVLQFYLSTLDLELVLAVDGKDALDKAQSRKIDLILTDLKMPRMSGIDFLSELRSRGIEAPAIVLTGHGDKDLAIQAMRLGAVDFLDKPFSGEELLHSIATFLEIENRKNLIREQAGELSPEAVQRHRRMIGLLRVLNQKQKAKGGTPGPAGK